jgi:uncharacterized membrane protein
MNLFKPIKNLFAWLKSLFLNGLFTTLPIIATIFFILFTYNLFVTWFQPLKKIEPPFLQNIPGSEILIVTIIILCIGGLVKLFVITPIIQKIENIIKKIPIIRAVYSSAKTVANFFNVPDPAHAHRKVVLIQFPKKGYYNIAFLLASAENDFKKVITKTSENEKTKKYYKVFMPNSPTPATGYFFILSEDEIIHTNITFEEAIKTVVSCGLVTPETLKNN